LGKLQQYGKKHLLGITWSSVKGAKRKDRARPRGATGIVLQAVGGNQSEMDILLLVVDP